MNTLLLVIIAILLLLLAVGLKAGIGFQLFLNIVLTLLVWLPGMVHVLWVVLKDEKHFCYCIFRSAPYDNCGERVAALWHVAVQQNVVG